MKDGMGWVSAPAVGQRFTDGAGNHWHVRDVINPGVDGHYIVRLSFGKSQECLDGISVLARAEFSALYQENGFAPISTEEPSRGPGPAQRRARKP
jgi:hypothetical protein